LLYRFDEGKGNIVHDMSQLGAKVDLKIDEDAVTVTKEVTTTPQTLSAHWVPSQGLALLPTSSVKSIIPADKLLSISNTNAFSMECWLSFDTMYPLDTGGLFSWDNLKVVDGTKRNLSLAYISRSLIMTPIGGANIAAGSRVYMLRPGLQHLVVTWDGVTTRVYRDGVKIQDLTVAWKPNQLLSGSAIILGNSVGMANPFEGTFYLFALHDHCLSDAGVLRHFNAGPSAK